MYYLNNIFDKCKKNSTLSLFSENNISTTLEECSNVSLEEQEIRKLECGSARIFSRQKLTHAGISRPV